jgi:hypothetical protein
MDEMWSLGNAPRSRVGGLNATCRAHRGRVVRRDDLGHDDWREPVMPTRPTKGDHGHADRGSREGGHQKAVVGTAVEPEVFELQAEAIGDGPWREEVAELHEEPTPQPRRRRKR